MAKTAKKITKAKKVVKKTEKPVNKPLYQAYVKVLGRVFEAEGSTVLEAISNLKPGVARGVCVLTIVNGDTRKERIFPGILTSRMFNTGGLIREINLKNASLRFGV